MSVTFNIAGERFDYDALPGRGNGFNLSNANARDLLAWIGLPESYYDDLCGELDAHATAARCRRRLWPEARNLDAEKPGHVDAAPGRATLIDCGRDAGYLQERTRWLLALCERAGDRAITFG